MNRLCPCIPGVLSSIPDGTCNLTGRLHPHVTWHLRNLLASVCHMVRATWAAGRTSLATQSGTPGTVKIFISSHICSDTNVCNIPRKYMQHSICCALRVVCYWNANNDNINVVHIYNIQRTSTCVAPHHTTHHLLIIPLITFPSVH